MASKSNPIDPRPCGKEKEMQNWEDVRDLFEQVFPKVGCATENWRMTDSLYPSHPDYPSCPTLAQLCTVAVSHGSDTYTVKLPCPRNRDPNIETGDSVMFQLDFDQNALYMGGHDDPIGTVKWWHGKPAEVPRGWYWISNSGPSAYNTRTGRYAVGFGKYPKNYWDNTSPGVDPLLGTLGMWCDGADLSIANHDFTPNVTVDDHPLTETSTEYTDITLDCSDSYVSEECLDNMYGYVDIRNHDHVVPIEEQLSVGVNAPGSTPVTVVGPTDMCSEPATTPPCGSPLPPIPVGLYDTCHDHYLYMDCDLTDPGHFHAFGPLSHTVTEDPITLTHDVEQMHLPRVYFLLIERLNNSANVTGTPVATTDLCIPVTRP